MVSNNEINKKLEEKQESINSDNINTEYTKTDNGQFNIICISCGAGNNSNSIFCSECGSPMEIKKTGYVVCNSCYGIYELQENETSEEFENCQCGGDLTFIQYIKELETLNKKCPICDYTNHYSVKRCENCGRCFDIGIEYFKSPLHDIEITSNNLRIYNKVDKKLTDVQQLILIKLQIRVL